VKKFGISMVQASKDLKSFQENNPGVIKYDINKKCYCASN